MFAWPRFISGPPKVRKPPAEERIEVAHEGAVFSVRVKRSRAARRLILRVRADSGEPVLTLPARSSLSTAKGFLQKHGGWIAARLARVPDTVAFVPGAIIPLRGVPHRILQGTGLRGGVVVSQHDGERIITVAGAPEHLSRRLTTWLKAEAKRDLTVASQAYAARLGVTIQKVSIKDTKSRWGSCSAAGALSFSWRMILAPPEVLDYLAAHELAHRVEMNHSTRYWRVVASICPHWCAGEAWLKQNGASLHRYGVPARS